MSPIIWRSTLGPEGASKLPPALSSSESELYAAALASMDVVWIRELLDELELFNVRDPSPLWIDNTGCIAIAQEPSMHKRFKHLRRRWCFIRSLCRDGTIMPSFVGTDLQDADIFTKPVVGSKRKQFTKSCLNHLESTDNPQNGTVNLLLKSFGLEFSGRGHTCDNALLSNSSPCCLFNTEGLFLSDHDLLTSDFGW